MPFSKEEVVEIKEKIAQGRSPIAIAQEYNSTHEPLDCLNKVIELSDYVMQLSPHIMGEGGYLHLSDRAVKIAYAHPCPRILLLDNVLDKDECDKIIDMCQPNLKTSTVQGTSPSISMARNSKTAYLNRGDNEFIAKIDARCAEIMNSPVEFGESLQVVRYGVGGQYMPHYDYFPKIQPGELKYPNGGNRRATLLMFLNDVHHGGRTYFPGLGLAVKPTRGSAIYFEYMNQRGQLDPSTLHGGEPVEYGVKWIMTKWAREHEHQVD